jgi:hypothetical protein
VFKGFTPAVLAVAFLLGAVSTARAQAESLTVTLLPGSVTFTLSSGSATNAGSVSIAATTSWLVLPTRNAVTLYGYFASASSALAHTASANTVDIPASRVEVSINGATAVPFNQTVPFGAAAAGRQLASQSITTLTLSGHRTDTLALNINLSGYTLPADTYSGVLRVRARATP